MVCRNILAIALVALARLQCGAGAPVGPIITTLPGTGNITVVNPSTHQPIPQFPATDGGSGMVNPILWAVYCSVVGVPLGVGGLRAGRIAIGTGVGFASVVLGEFG